MGGWIGLFDLWGKRKEKEAEWKRCELSFFLMKIAGDGTRWKLEIEYTFWLVFFFTFLRVGVGVELYAPDE